MSSIAVASLVYRSDLQWFSVSQVSSCLFWTQVSIRCHFMGSPLKVCEEPCGRFKGLPCAPASTRVIIASWNEFLRGGFSHLSF